MKPLVLWKFSLTVKTSYEASHPFLYNKPPEGMLLLPRNQQNHLGRHTATSLRSLFSLSMPEEVISRKNIFKTTIQNKLRSYNKKTERGLISKGIDAAGTGLQGCLRTITLNFSYIIPGLSSRLASYGITPRRKWLWSAHNTPISQYHI